MKYLKEMNNEIYVYDTYFFDKLYRCELQNYVTWGKRIDLNNKTKLFFPILTKNRHWVLIYVDLKLFKISYYDSLLYRYKRAYLKEIVKEYISKVYYYIHCKYIEFQQKWKILFKDCPQQNNLYDCGVFICKYVEYLSMDKKFDFTQKDMNRFRKKIFSAVYPEENCDNVEFQYFFT